MLGDHLTRGTQWHTQVTRRAYNAPTQKNVTSKTEDYLFLFFFFSQKYNRIQQKKKKKTRTKKQLKKRKRNRIEWRRNLTWTSNSMKSIGKQEAALKDEIEFSLNALILRSDDCNTFIPCPLCPITKNFGILYALLPNSTPKKSSYKQQHIHQ